MPAFINVLMGMPIDCRGVNTLTREGKVARLKRSCLFFFFLTMYIFTEPQ